MAENNNSEIPISLKESLNKRKESLQTAMHKAIKNAPFSNLDEEGNVQSLLEASHREAAVMKKTAKITFTGDIDPNQVVIDASEANLYPWLIATGMKIIGVPERNINSLVDEFSHEEFRHLIASYEADSLQARSYGIEFHKTKIGDNEPYVISAFVKFKGETTVEEYRKILAAGQIPGARLPQSDAIKL